LSEGGVFENMALRTFKGGVHPRYNKDATFRKRITSMPSPGKVVIPLHQHTGAPCEPLVKVGDDVRVGQKIGDSKAALTAPVHASVSGKVKAIAKHPQSSGVDGLSIVIESDGQGTPDESIKMRTSVDELGEKELIA